MPFEVLAAADEERDDCYFFCYEARKTSDLRYRYSSFYGLCLYVTPCAVLELIRVYV